MTEKKEQKIVVLLSLLPSDKNLILNGIRIATIFKKELCLCYNYSKKKKNSKEKFKSTLHAYSLPLKKEIPQLKVSTLLLSEKIPILPERLSDNFEAIFLIAAKSQFPAYSKALIESPVPFLFIDETGKVISEFRKLILPVDMRKEISDSALWSSYFGRFNRAEIEVVAASDRGKQEQAEVTQNVILTKKLFLKFGIRHKIIKGRRSSLGIAFESLEYALKSGAEMLIILGSSTITPLDLMVGLPEKKLIRKSAGLPVLILNPRRDNYILCD